MRKKVNVSHIRIIAVLLVSILPIFYMSGSFYRINNNSSSETAVKNIETLGMKYKKSISLWIKDLMSDLDLYASSEPFEKFETEGIKDFCEKLKSIKPEYRELLVFNKEGNLICGSRYNLDGDNLESCLSKARAGKAATSEVFKIVNNLYVYAAVPIRNSTGKETTGVLCAIISLDSLSDMVKTQADSRGIECYIVDKNGMFLTNSLYVEDAPGNKYIDLRKLKNSIDYSKNIPYENYRKVQVYGLYYDIDDTNLTLVIEQDKSFNDTSSKKIIDTGKYLSLIQIAIIAVLKKFFDYLMKYCPAAGYALKSELPKKEKKEDEEYEDIKSMVQKMIEDSFRKGRE